MGKWKNGSFIMDFYGRLLGIKTVKGLLRLDVTAERYPLLKNHLKEHTASVLPSIKGCSLHCCLCFKG